MSKLYLQTDGDHIYLYMNHEKGKENSYLRYDLHHCVVPYEGGIYQNMNQWRLYELYAYELRDGELVQTLPYMLINGGEWECAIQIKDTRDFHGGIHGYEHYKKVSAKINGEDFSFPGTPFEGWVDTFEFEQESIIIQQETENTPAAKHLKQYLFKDGKISLHQEVEWLYDCMLVNQFLTMYPIRRTSDDTPNGEQISDRLIFGGDPVAYDIGPEGHTNGKARTGITHAKIWGEELGLYSEVTVDYDQQPTDIFFVRNDATYNKMYFSTARDRDVKKGDVFEMNTTFEAYRK